MTWKRRPHGVFGMDSRQDCMRKRIADRLTASPSLLLPLWAIAMSFSTYFCMYAFRKPFAAGTYEGETVFGGALELKTAFVISQIVGYAISKYVGIKVCSEVTRNRRFTFLVVAIVSAEMALFLFAVLPAPAKIVAIFLNGLPLGFIWGFVVSYLEGRRTSEVQLAGLSCSFIVASGVVKDIGRWLMGLGVTEYWMPFVTGLLFFPPLFAAAYLLDMLPDPDDNDVRERVLRQPMTSQERWQFLARFAVGLSLLLVAYLGLTAFRDFRDNYGIEIFTELGYGDHAAIFTKSELWVAFGLMAALALLSLIHNNRRGLAAVFGLMISGCALIGLSTMLMQAGRISGLIWMILTGLGAYLAYVPFGSVLFDRIIAATRTVGTAVFAIYVADAAGYTGSVGLQLYRDFAYPDTTRLQFFIGYCYILALGGVILLTLGFFDFDRACRHAEHDKQPDTAPLE